MITVKIQSKSFCDDVLHVVASVENAIGTLIGSYSLQLPEDAPDNQIQDMIRHMCTN